MPRPARRRWPIWPLIVIAMLAAGHWAWQQPWAEAARLAWQLSRLPPPDQLPMPVAGVRARAVADTWGGARSGGRTHEGVDIFAKRGTPVLATTPGVVLAVRDFGLGGKQVWLHGPAGERHYYAHLEGFAAGIQRFDSVQPGDVLGYVGDSGNAGGTPPHLHYAIYAHDGAYNPWPLLQAGAPPR